MPASSIRQRLHPIPLPILNFTLRPSSPPTTATSPLARNSHDPADQSAHDNRNNPRPESPFWLARSHCYSSCYTHPRQHCHSTTCRSPDLLASNRWQPETPPTGFPALNTSTTPAISTLPCDELENWLRPGRSRPTHTLFLKATGERGRRNTTLSIKDPFHQIQCSSTSPKTGCHLVQVAQEADIHPEPQSSRSYAICFPS